MNCSKFVFALTTLNMYTLLDYLTADNRHSRQHGAAFISQTPQKVPSSKGRVPTVKKQLLLFSKLGSAANKIICCR